jgi:ABC-2 type transport system permease protein
VGIGVLDQDKSMLSREYLAQLGSTDALSLDVFPESLEAVEEIMMRSQAKAVVIIPHDFERDIRAGKTAELQVVVDGTDPNTAGHAIRHVSAHTENFTTEVISEQLLKRGVVVSGQSAIDLRTRAWYNPSFRYTVSMIPALVGIVLSVPAMAASLALAREREWGTLEGLIATPIGRLELIIGKLVPYILAGLISVPLCVATAVYMYNVDFQGNLWAYFLLSALYLASSISISMFISIFANSQQVAIIASMIIFFFSGFFMSGLLIPFSIMGPLIKMEALMFPTTHFVIISRGIFIKGISPANLSGYIIAMTAIGLMFLGLSMLMFKKKL